MEKWEVCEKVINNLNSGWDKESCIHSLQIHSISFLDVVHFGSISLTKVFLSKKESLTDEVLEKALNISSHLGYLDIIKLLIESGVNADTPTDTKKYPLLLACMHSHAKCFKFLLDHTKRHLTDRDLLNRAILKLDDRFLIQYCFRRTLWG